MNIACEFGENQRLKGILSSPEENRREDLVVVLVSAGFTAKMGPHRMYAELARSLADAGIATLRFDLGGIGNSQTLHSGTPLDIRTMDDIKDAMDFMQEQHGISQFVIGGLCSGAEDGFRYAEGDDRVKGVLLIDPHAYKTSMWPVRRLFSRHFLNRIVCKFMQVTKIMDIAGNNGAPSNVKGLENNLIDYAHTSHQRSTQILNRLLKRHVYLHYVYTGGRTMVFNHKRQFFKMFRDIEFGNQLTLDFIPHIDHTQVFEEDRHELVSTIVQRFSSTYG